MDQICRDALEMAKKIHACARWAVNNRPELVQQALHAKKFRTRKKNLVRIVKEYKEDIHGQ